MPYIGKKPADIIATAVDTTTGTFSGAVSASSVDADGGVTVDNITIDGTEIDLSSGNLTLDVAGQLIINSDSGQIVLQDDTVNWGNLQNSSGDFIIGSLGADKDIIFQGLDGSSTITALTLDMSDGGRAAFAHNADFVDGRGIRLGDGNDFQLYHDGTDSYLLNSTGDLIINSAASDEDIIFKGNDGGSTVTALSFDMSDGGAATFAKGITLTNGNVALANGNGIDFSATGDNTAQSSSMASELLDDYEEGTWTPSFSVTTTAGDLGYFSRQGSYIKIGNQVTVWFYINAYENNASGDFRVNVPFTSQNVSNYFAVASLTKTGFTSVTGDIEGRISANATIINLVIVNNANESANVTQANTDPNFYLYGTITYKTA